MLEAANHLMHLEETPAQKQYREDLEVGDFIMRASSGQAFTDDELVRIRD
jgi:hypothetical protein